mmetsp:Transcript_20589/g.67410  ORF Transcript_20589/g.67410 Transcript_20589/m.67410 type:complete len:200 (-) Transcript_20589:117-716(-)
MFKRDRTECRTYSRHCRRCSPPARWRRCPRAARATQPPWERTCTTCTCACACSARPPALPVLGAQTRALKEGWRSGSPRREPRWRCGARGGRRGHRPARRQPPPSGCASRSALAATRAHLRLRDVRRVALRRRWHDCRCLRRPMRRARLRQHAGWRCGRLGRVLVRLRLRLRPPPPASPPSPPPASPPPPPAPACVAPP